MQETSTELENPFTSKSYSQNDKDPSLLTADKEENPPDLHPSGVSSAAGGSRDLAEMEEPDINADSSSNYLHNITADHLQTKYLELKSCHRESTQSTPQLVLATQLPGNPSPVVVRRSIARFGKISYQLGDLQVWDPEFKIPNDIQERLITKHRHTRDIEVRIIRNSDVKFSLPFVRNVIFCYISTSTNKMYRNNKQMRFRRRLKGLCINTSLLK